MEEISADSPRMRSGDTSSPEFEFWMVDKNPSLPPPGRLLTADQLFVDGVLLPLDLLSLSQSNSDNSTLESEPELESGPQLPPAPVLPPCSDLSTSSPPSLKITMKWKDLKELFKVGEKTLEEIRERRNQRRSDRVGGNAELNIHIWPFSRSRSAGNARAGAGAWNNSRLRTSRKVSSAPCSRSNSRGESSKPAGDASVAAAAAAATSTSSRRWTARPAGFAGGIRLGRIGPVVKLRRKTNPNPNPNSNSNSNSSPNPNPNPNQPELKEIKPNSSATAGGGARRGGGINAGVRVLNFNVNTCIGYRNQVSNCKVSGSDHGEGCGGGGADDRRGTSNGSLFYLRTIFSKKVY